MQRRFESDPLFQATTLLLQERVPKAVAFYSALAELPELARQRAGRAETPMRVFRNVRIRRRRKCICCPTAGTT